MNATNIYFLVKIGVLQGRFSVRQSQDVNLNHIVQSKS
jgi:hypothetical protein